MPDALAKLLQSLLKPTFLDRYPVRQDRGDSFMNGPKLVQGHRFEIFKFHLTNSNNVCAEAGLLLAVAFEGLFGRVRDDLMVRLPTILFGRNE